jgi:hypothetical protein
LLNFILINLGYSFAYHFKQRTILVLIFLVFYDPYFDFSVVSSASFVDTLLRGTSFVITAWAALSVHYLFFRCLSNEPKDLDNLILLRRLKLSQEKVIFCE